MHNEQERLENGLFGDCEEKSGREGGEGERDRERERRVGRERSNVRGRRRGIGGGWVGRVSWSIS